MLQYNSLLVLIGTVALAHARDLYVKQGGEDQKTCGTDPASPCRSIRYTISQVSQWNDVIHVDPSLGSYTNESDVDYLTISHSVQVIGQNQTQYGPATILCQQPQAHKLFNVSDTRNLTDSNKAQTVTLTLTNIKIQGCKPNINRFGQGVMTINNGMIMMVNSQFVNNGIILHHTQDIDNPCELLKVYVFNSSFSSNLISKPYQPGITLLGCKKLEVILTSVTFKTTALKLQSSETIKVTFFNVSIDGRGLRGSSVSITLANSTNISLTNSTIENHMGSKESAISIVTNTPSGVPPNIHLKQVRLLNNIGQKSAGGALAVFSRFMQTTAFPMNIQLQMCEFINNSATDNGGSIYFKGINGVKINQCLFFNNTGLNGGAIHADKLTNFALSNTVFMLNTAKDEGDIITKAGALYSSDSDISITNCTFKQNRANYTPGTLYIQNATTVSIQHSLFESTQDISDQPESNMLLIENTNPPTIASTVQIVHCTFNVTSLADHTMLDAKAHVDMHNGGNQFICPQGYDVQKISTPADMVDKFDYYHVVYWCQSCPEGQYHVPYDFHDTPWPNQENHHRRPVACLPCPEHATCKHGQVKPMANYWPELIEKNNTAKHVKMVLCLPGQCCPGNECSTLDSCLPNHEGPLCSQCSTNYTLHLGNHDCIHHEDCKPVIFTILLSFTICIFVVVLCLVIFKIVLVFSWKYDPSNDVFGREDNALDRSLNMDEENTGGRPAQDEDDDVSLFDDPDNNTRPVNQDEPLLVPGPETGTPKKAENCHHKLNLTRQLLGCFLILVMFSQLMPVVYTSYSSQDSWRYKLSYTMASLYYFRFPFSLLDDICSIADLGAVGKVLYQLIQSWMLWLCAFFIFLTAFVQLKCCIKSNNPWSRRFESACRYFCSIFAILLIVMFIPTTVEYMKLLHCIELDNEQVLYVDSSTICNQWWQIMLWVYLGAFVFPLVLVLAFGTALVRSCSISCTHFIISTCLPLPALLVWAVVFRPKSLREKLKCKYNFKYDMMEELSNDNNRLSPGSKAVLAIFHGPYHKLKSKWYHFHWNSVLLFQSLIVIFISTFLSQEPILRAFVLTLVMLLCLVVQATVKPFATVLLNRVQTLFLTSLSAMSILGTYAATMYSNDVVLIDMNQMLFGVCEWTFTVILATPVLMAIFISLAYCKCCCK